MELEMILTHMNDHHRSELEGLLKKFAQVPHPKNPTLLSVDLTGLDISYDDGKTFRIEFPQKIANTTDAARDAIIELCQSVPKTLQMDKVKEEMQDFIDGLGSVVISSLDAQNQVICSYAPLLRSGDKYYIYISEVSEHYHSLKTHPKNVEVMFLEDESKAKSVILRKRLRYKAEVEFIPRGEEFDKAFDAFVDKTGGAGGIKTIRNMMDFHLVLLHFKNGRFVKGFGQAYDIIDGKISYIGGDGNPHKMKNNS